jgi:hypothetical protein
MTHKIIGVTYHGDSAGNPYPLMKASGIGWYRTDIPFPFADQLNGQLTPAYQAKRAELNKANANGIKILSVLPQWGHRYFDTQAGENLWHDAFPAWMGTPADAAFYDRFTRVAEFVAQDLTDRISGYWQVGNELDTATFRGPYSLEQAVRFAFAGAIGVKRVHSDDRCGINPAELSSSSRELFKLAYASDSPLDYAGIDNYFGSWIPGEVTNWIPTIDEVFALTGKPVLVSEWGYPSLGQVLEFDLGLMEHMYSMTEDERVAELASLGFPPGVNPFCILKGWANACGGAHDEVTQADYITAGLKIFAEHPQVIGSFLYCWRDSDTCYHCGQPECPSECGWGLVKTDETPKLGLLAFKAAVEKYYLA